MKKKSLMMLAILASASSMATTGHVSSFKCIDDNDTGTGARHRLSIENTDNSLGGGHVTSTDGNKDAGGSAENNTSQMTQGQADGTSSAAKQQTDTLGAGTTTTT